MRLIKFTAARHIAMTVLAGFGLLCSSVFAPGIASAQQAEMEGIVQALEAKASKLEADAKKLLFVHAARKADIETMIDLTSRTTLHLAGDDEIRRIYRETYIPRFQRLNEDAGECLAIEIADPDGTNGWNFVCKLTNDRGESMYVRVTVLHEEKWVVAAIKFADAQ
jgi:hypothetical protein